MTKSEGSIGCPFRDDQFSRAIATGSIAILAPELRDSIINAYVAVGRANALVHVVASRDHGAASFSGGASPWREASSECEVRLCDARRRLLKYLGHGPDSQ